MNDIHYKAMKLILPTRSADWKGDNTHSFLEYKETENTINCERAYDRIN